MTVSRLQLVYVPDLLLKTIVFQGRVGKHHAQAILADATFFDAQGSEVILEVGMGVAILLHLYDTELRDRVLHSCDTILEIDIEVDCQTLRLLLVHQRDAEKAVPQAEVYLIHLELRLLVEESDGLLVMQHILVSDRNTFFGSSTLVVLLFDLKEHQIGLHILAHTDFLTI